MTKIIAVSAITKEQFYAAELSNLFDGFSNLSSLIIFY